MKLFWGVSTVRVYDKNQDGLMWLEKKFSQQFIASNLQPTNCVMRIYTNQCGRRVFGILFHNPLAPVAKLDKIFIPKKYLGPPNHSKSYLFSVVQDFRNIETECFWSMPIVRCQIQKDNQKEPNVFDPKTKRNEMSVIWRLWVGLRVLPLMGLTFATGTIVDRRSWKPPSPRFRGLFGCTCPESDTVWKQNEVESSDSKN